MITKNGAVLRVIESRTIIAAAEYILLLPSAQREISTAFALILNVSYNMNFHTLWKSLATGSI